MEEIIHEKQRRECWISVWSAVASAFNSQKPEVSTRWADEALKAFDARFNKEQLKSE